MQHDMPAWDISAWMDNALSSTGLPRCEDPMRDTVPGDYLTWLQTSRQNRFASGRCIAQSARVTVALWAGESSQWQEQAQAIVNALIAAGARSARIGPDAWLEDVKRRQVQIYVLLRREVG